MFRHRIGIWCVLVLLSGSLSAQTDTITTADSIEFLPIATLADTSLDTTAFHFNPFTNFWSHDPHSVKRAALYSAILPGLGQAYNGKYWKIPIVYAAIGTSGYFIYYWYDFYDELRAAYLARTDADPETIDALYAYIPSDEILLQYVEQSKQYLDLMVVVTAGVYALNIIDAIVDAHLYAFDISDDLSMQVSPTYLPVRGFQMPQTGSVGLQLKFSLK